MSVYRNQTLATFAVPGLRRQGGAKRFGEGDGFEETGRIEVVVTGLIDDADEGAGVGLGVRSAAIDLAAFE